VRLSGSAWKSESLRARALSTLSANCSRRALVHVEQLLVGGAHDEQRQRRRFDELAQLGLVLAQRALQARVLVEEAARQQDAADEEQPGDHQHAAREKRLGRSEHGLDLGRHLALERGEREVERVDAVDGVGGRGAAAHLRRDGGHASG
jgi:hypothetical protein